MNPSFFVEMFILFLIPVLRGQYQPGAGPRTNPTPPHATGTNQHPQPAASQSVHHHLNAINAINMNGLPDPRTEGGVGGNFRILQISRK
jgi:hypothetical protein